MYKKISVIIPTYCSKNFGVNRLLGALLSYQNQTLSKEAFEIILVDDGSDVDIKKHLSEWNLNINIRYIRKNHTGMCSSIARGIEEASNEILLLGIDDNIAHPNLLEKHLKSHNSSLNSLVIGREYHARSYKGNNHPFCLDNEASSEELISYNDIKYNFDKLVNQSEIIDKYKDIENIFESKSKFDNNSCSWLVMRIGNHSISKTTLESVGGIDINFDPSGWYMDLELGLRLIEKNINFLFDKTAVMIHISHDHSDFTIKDEVQKHQYFYNKHKYTEVALLPFFFASKLTISEYSKLISKVKKLNW